MFIKANNQPNTGVLISP